MTYPQAVNYSKDMPRLSKKVSKERAIKLSKTYAKANGNQAEVARKLGVTRQTIYKKTKNPEFQSLRQQAIAIAAKRSGLTLARIYNALNESLDANQSSSYLGRVYDSNIPDHKTRQVGAKIGLELFEHLGGDLKEESKPTEIHVHYGHRTKPPIKNTDEVT